MSDWDAFGGEMEFSRRLTAEQTETIIAGRDPADRELAELAAFTRGLRSSLIRETRAAADAALIVRLAEAARVGAAEVGVHSPNGLGSSPRRPRPRRRLALVARVAVAVAAVPLLFAGLAFAGVTLPGPAQSVFEELGIELPNQAAGEDDDTEGTAQDGDSAGSATGQENSAGKLGDGKSKSNPTRSRERGPGKQDQGGALGKRELTPGIPLDAGKPRSNPGGSGGDSSGNAQRGDDDSAGSAGDSAGAPGVKGGPAGPGGPGQAE